MNRLLRRYIGLIALLVLLAISTTAGAKTPSLRKIESNPLQADFQIARTALEQGHSGIYRYTPKIELDQAFDPAAKNLDRPIDSLDSYPILAPAFATLNSG